MSQRGQRDRERPAAREARSLPPRLVMLSSFAGTSVLNYAFGLAAGWLLIPGDFGLLAFAQTVLLIGGLLLNSGFTWSLAAELVRSEPAARGPLVRGAALANLGLGLGLGALVVGLFALGPLRAGLESWPVTIVIALTLPLLSFITVARAAGQGYERFPLVAGMQVCEVLSKTAVGIVLMQLGFGAFGAMVGFLAGAALTALLGAALLVGSLHISLVGRAVRPALRTAGSMFGALLGSALLLNLDVVALKLFTVADRTVVGHYQAGIVLANMPYYLSSALVPILFTQLARAGELRRGAATVGEALGLMLALVIPIEVALAIAPGQVLGLLFPPAYQPGAAALRLLALGNCALIPVAILSAALQATGNAKISACILLTTALLEALALRLAVPVWHAEGAALVFLAATSGALLAFGAVFLRALGRPAAQAAAAWLGRYLIALGAGCALGGVGLALSGNVILAAALGGPLYLGLALWLRLLRLPRRAGVARRPRLRKGSDANPASGV